MMMIIITVQTHTFYDNAELYVQNQTTEHI